MLTCRLRDANAGFDLGIGDFEMCVDRPIIIEKYANRRRYNTGTYTFVTLDELAAMVKRGKKFLVYEAKTGADITRSVLAQIVFGPRKLHGPR